MLQVYFKLGNDLTAGCKIAINCNAACHLSEMKYSTNDFWMVMIDLNPPVALSFFCFFKNFFIMQVNLQNEKKNILAFIHRALFILDSLPTLDIWPCKTHSSVIMLSKYFCYKSVIWNNQLMCHSHVFPLSLSYHVIHLNIWACCRLRVTFCHFFKCFTAFSCLSVCLIWVDGIH